MSPVTVGATCSGRCPGSSSGWCWSRMCLVYPSVPGRGEQRESTVGTWSAGNQQPEHEGLAHPKP